MSSSATAALVGGLTSSTAALNAALKAAYAGGLTQISISIPTPAAGAAPQVAFQGAVNPTPAPAPTSSTGMSGTTGSGSTTSKPAPTPTPTPTPTPKPVPKPTGPTNNVSTTLAPLDAGDYPYAPTSYVKCGIGDGVKWVDPSAAPEAYEDLTASPITINSGQYSMPFYRGRSTDKLVWIKCLDSMTGTPGLGFGMLQMRVPANATPAVGGDRHMIFYDGRGFIAHCYGCTLPAGGIKDGSTITCELGAITDINGDAIQSFQDKAGLLGSAYRFVARPSRYQFGIGVPAQANIDLAEIIGDYGMMMRFLSPPPRTAPTANWLTAPWPNEMTDFFELTGQAGNDTGPNGEPWGKYQGHIPAGCTIGIPDGVDVNDIKLPDGTLVGDTVNRPVRDFAYSLNRRGATWKDTIGSPGIGFSFSPLLERTAYLARLRYGVSSLLPVIRFMANQGPNSINGGGNYFGRPPIPAMITAQA